MWKWTQSSLKRIEALERAHNDLAHQVDDLQASVLEARLKYIEALDKMLGKLAGRLDKRMQQLEAAQEPSGAPIVHGEGSYYTPAPTRGRGNLRGW